MIASSKGGIGTFPKSSLTKGVLTDHIATQRRANISPDPNREGVWGVFSFKPVGYLTIIFLAGYITGSFLFAREVFSRGDVTESRLPEDWFSTNICSDFLFQMFLIVFLQ